MDNLKIENFFKEVRFSGSKEIIVVVDSCSFIRYHEAFATFLPTFHHCRTDLKFFFPFIVHQELDAMKNRRKVSDNVQEISSAIGVIDMLLDLSCEHPNLAFVFQSSNDAGVVAAAQLPHNANDDDILLSALYLCHKDAVNLRRVVVLTDDRNLQNKVRVSGLTVVGERNGKLMLLPPPPQALSRDVLEQRDSLRNIVMTPPDDGELRQQDAMAIDSDEAELNKANCVKNSPMGPPSAKMLYDPSPTSPFYRFVGGEGSDWNSGDDIVPKHLQQPQHRQRLSMPATNEHGGRFISGRKSQMEMPSSGMYWDFSMDNSRPQSAIPSVGHGYEIAEQQKSPQFRPHQYQQQRFHSSAPRRFQPTTPGSDPLSVFLCDVVIREMENAYGADELVWTDVCCLRKRPVSWRDAIYAIDKMVFGTSKIVTNARDLILKNSRAESSPSEEILRAGRVLANTLVHNAIHGNAARNFLQSVPFVDQPQAGLHAQFRY